ncbi:MAG: hypothetical protein Q4G50_05905 [Corynebacterium sp.]|uniref:hypothetical protein n=1 Tax=Corynebacterium sp. TaxID=1720 RepID=UPI0026E072BB|nr:hypothetical protein [Corynebacterium sp.]MDO5669520.1 hypothetical protein [Corynebacterium sp.]
MRWIVVLSIPLALMACGSNSAIPNERIHTDSAQACWAEFSLYLQEESSFIPVPAADHVSVSFERPARDTAVVTAQTTVVDETKGEHTVRYRCRATHRHGGSGMAGAHHYEAMIESAEIVQAPK